MCAVAFAAKIIGSRTRRRDRTRAARRSEAPVGHSPDRSPVCFRVARYWKTAMPEGTKL